MLQTTLIGHACLLIQSRETTILTDPVWFDYLWEEINVLCPSIVLEKEKIPPVDVLNISHRHQDHFDVRTLAYLLQDNGVLKPDVTVLAPNDDIVLKVMRELGFENITVVSDFETIRVKDIEITPTPSGNQESTAQDTFPEHGLLVHDGEVTLWNQVDSLVNPNTIDRINQKYGRVDLAHGRFVPLLEGNFSYNKPFNLPFNEYCTFLNMVKALQPRFVVPGSAAFRYRDEFSFLNRYSFPTTQDQYLRDLKNFCPEVPAGHYNPGDVAHITTSEVKIEHQSSPFVRVLEDDSEKLIFKPVMEVAPMRTRTKDPKECDEEMLRVREFVENRFLEKLTQSELLEAWQHWNVVYQLEVFGKEGSEIWSIDFEENPVRVQNSCLGKINLYEGIAASELDALVRGETSWDFVALCGNYRTFNNIYRVTNGNFEYFPSEKLDVALEPLMVAFPWNSEMDLDKFMRDVRRWKGVPQS